MPIEITARLGSARPMLETLIAKNENRWTWPSHTPSGTAMRMAMPIAANETSRCDTVLDPIRLRLLKKKVKASTNACMSHRPEAAAAPGRDQPLDQDEQQVGDDREQHRERARGDELGLEAGLDRVEDRRARDRRRRCRPRPSSG